MFNCLRTIWPKGYQRGSPKKGHQNSDYLKTSNAKKWLFPGLLLVAFRQDYQEGGQGEQRPWGPWSLGGSWVSGGLWKWHWQISLWNIEDQFGKNCCIFLFVFLGSQSRRCPIFELTPGPRLALGATANN